MSSHSPFNPQIVERKIQFFRVDAGNDKSGQPIPYDPNSALVFIHSLDYQDIDDSGPYLDTVDGSVGCWVDSVNAPHRLRYVRIRKTGLPSLLQQGALGPLGIPPDSGLAEAIHVSFFDNNIAGSDFNFYGPRVSTLGDYLRRKAPAAGPVVRFEPLLNMDATEKLGRLRDISVLKLRVRPSFINVIAQLDSDLSAGLQALQQAGESEEIEIVMRPRPYSKSTLNQRMLDFVRGIAGISGGTLREEARKFEVRGFDETLNRATTLDVLNDQLITSKRMVKQDERSRAVTSTSAYSAISEAYEELRNDLNRATSARA